MRHIITDAYHALINKYITDKDIIVDATCGNGNDTYFLASISKWVYSFDIQENALTNAKLLCQSFDNITYILDSHENIFKYLDKAKGYCFNLGYLPNGNKDITTKEKSTIIALKRIINKLEVGDFIIITFYSHEEGKKEASAVLDLLKNLDLRNYDILKTSLEFKKNTPPFFYFILKTN
ncbi:class I SAM-dependent methyltransferase [Acholeplasma sp. OttesenSCG-928-E16]|nr:class I SAM-dependent methyltransferase [Acholeplasma sp. OttesenSCG-928-E16]